MTLLSEKREQLDAVSELLLEKEVIGHEEMTALLGERSGQDAAYDYATLAQLAPQAEEDEGEEGTDKRT
eukprot:SAG11_NODE_2653_length_3124_cov_2.301818_5_plen_69_part_00